MLWSLVNARGVGSVCVDPNLKNSSVQKYDLNIFRLAAAGKFNVDETKCHPIPNL